MSTYLEHLAEREKRYHDLYIKEVQLTARLKVALVDIAGMEPIPTPLDAFELATQTAHEALNPSTDNIEF